VRSTPANRLRRGSNRNSIRCRRSAKALIDRIEVSVDQIDIRLHPPRLGALLDVTATPFQSMTGDEIQTLSVPVCLRRAGREIRMVIDGTDPDITHAILDGQQPRDLTAEKLLEHSRLPLAWHDQRTVLGFA
jgi:hypothetical protein